MRKNLWRALLAGAFSALVLSACTTAYAATKTTETSADTEEEKDQSSSANVSAQEAMDLLKDLLSGGSGKAAEELAEDDAGSSKRDGQSGTKDEEIRTITVSASGTARTVPDKAEISFGVSTQAKTPGDAQKENAETIDRVVAHLKERGIEEKSIQTSSFNLYPEYDYNGNIPKITGYQARTILTVTDQAIDEAGDIVSECVQLGINDVNNFRFYASSYDEAYEEALKAAVEAARKKAAFLAECAECELGPVLSISEGYQDTSVRYAKANYAVEEVAADVAAFGMSVMPGEAAITAQVTATFRIR